MDREGESYIHTNNNVSTRSVEKGMEILPPFETPVGRVGLAICFDVSCNDRFKVQTYSYIIWVRIVTIPRDQPGAQAPERADHHLPLRIHGANRECALGGSAPCSSHRDAVICDSSRAGWPPQREADQLRPLYDRQPLGGGGCQAWRRV